MINQSGMNNNATYKAWAEITMARFQDKIIALDLIDTAALYKSLRYHLIRSSNGDMARIEFFYKLYGIYQDIKRNWKSKIFFREVSRLREILEQKYGEAAARNIVAAINTVNLKKQI